MASLRTTALAVAAGLALTAPMAQAQSSDGQSWQELSGYTDQPTTFNRSASIFAPWDNPPSDAKNFTVPEVNNLPDLHGDIVDPQLVIYFAGNQYMVVQDLIAAFQRAYPQYKRIFYVTLPPGILLDAVKNHDGAFAIGNLRIAMKPDVLTRGKGAMEAMQKDEKAFSDLQDYADNELALMVAKGNPLHIQSLADLADPATRVTMPNPDWEGIAKVIEKSYVKAGGQALDDKIMKDKVRDGSTYLTHIHHRQSPMRVMAGLADAAPVWLTEAEFHSKRADEGIDMVKLPDSENSTLTYTAGVLKTAPHPEAAKDFVTFLTSSDGQKIYHKYGFASPGTLN
ncbi:molybdate ABC transporter substrate-binding protein [Thioclava electrotropha]|uniref:Substrate-binding domain-containing protein n=1 Tax=Thioclava electrotropha TaxID=1549850 RepID=A0ABX6YSW6_9RHOB|nr:substrate-binding domain-containing protein [Thioclava electrotropha]QPZ90315.1 substrate-binding domain-containing protein [Thioclava electrotropha]